VKILPLLTRLLGPALGAVLQPVPVIIIAALALGAAVFVRRGRTRETNE